MHNVCRMTYWPCKRIPDTQCSPNLLRDETAVALRLQYADRENWDNAWLMPTSVTLTTDENNERLKIMSNVDTYVSEMSLKFHPRRGRSGDRLGRLCEQLGRL